MSRNLQRHSMVTPTKKPSRKIFKSKDVSSDDDYAGVELISESEEDEPDVEVAEEQAIIDSEEDDDDLQETPRPSIDGDQASWHGFDMQSESEYPENAHFNEHMLRGTPWSYPDDTEGTSPTRHVRFDLESDDSDSGSEGTVENLIPDLFVAQDNLDPHFRKMIERDDDAASSGNESYWDFNNSDEDSPEKADFSSDEGNSSGYESDDGGSTTEEDLPPESQYAPARSVLPPPPDASDDSSSEEEITIQRRQPIRRRGPRLGSWINDGSKPYALIDKSTKQLILFNFGSARPGMSSATGTPNHNFSQRSRIGLDISPMVQNSMMNVLMPALHNSNSLNAGGEIVGPPEAFLPFVGVNTDGTLSHDSLTDYEQDDWDLGFDGDNMDITDFIHFAEDASDENEPEEVEQSSDSPTTMAEATTPTSTPARPTTLSSEDQVHHLLTRFDNGLVGAFRQNQARHKLLSQHAESAESLSFHNSNGMGPIRGIKQGRLPNANSPITPLRKRKATRPHSQSIGSSPFTARSAGHGLFDGPSEGNEGRKRKMDDDIFFSHKRNRSLA